MPQMSTYSYDQNSHNFPNIFSSLEAYIGEFNLKVNHVSHLTLRLGGVSAQQRGDVDGEALVR